jgi:hypothetical protein
MTALRGRWRIQPECARVLSSGVKSGPLSGIVKTQKHAVVKMVLVMMTVDEDNGNGPFAPGREGFLKQVLAG